MPDARDTEPAGRLGAPGEWLRANGETILGEQLEIARCPAPPYEERQRGDLVAAKLRDLGLDCEFDAIGNLFAHLPGSSGDAEAPLMLAAHLDTVFARDVPIEIRQEGQRWVGPGVSDNARGIAVLLSVARALTLTDARTHFPLVLAFTVGEEGAGDLRGVKHIFRPESPFSTPRAFIAVDGGGLRRIICTALGSRRFRVTVRGPGGHSWTDWGRVNPASAVAAFIARTSGLDLPRQPRTTVTAARHGGGTSINAIPSESWVELDLRSESQQEIETVAATLRNVLAAAVEAERAERAGDLDTDWQIIGERPAARLSTSDNLVVACLAATRGLGVEPEFAVSSTDANVPMALGVPAVAIGGGGRSGDTHTEHEWFEDSDGPAGALRLLDLIGALNRD